MSFLPPHHRLDSPGPVRAWDNDLHGELWAVSWRSASQARSRSVIASTGRIARVESNGRERVTPALSSPRCWSSWKVKQRLLQVEVSIVKGSCKYSKRALVNLFYKRVPSRRSDACNHGMAQCHFSLLIIDWIHRGRLGREIMTCTENFEPRHGEARARQDPVASL